MKYNFEKNKIETNRKNKKIHGVFHSIFTKDINSNTVKRFRDGGFIAWPEAKLSASEMDDEIREGRTKGGGYIAFPK